MIVQKILAIISLILLLIFQTSFINNLHYPWSLIPLFSAVCVVSIQQRGAWNMAFALIGYGLFLDLFSLGIGYGETLAYAGMAIVCVFSARSIFTNRSLYGVMACAGLSNSTLLLIESILHPSLFSFFQESFLRVLFLILTSAIVFRITLFVSGLIGQTIKNQRKSQFVAHI